MIARELAARRGVAARSRARRLAGQQQEGKRHRESPDGQRSVCQYTIVKVMFARSSRIINSHHCFISRREWRGPSLRGRAKTSKPHLLTPNNPLPPPLTLPVVIPLPSPPPLPPISPPLEPPLIVTAAAAAAADLALTLSVA